ncbi:hypothetical protein NEOLI_004865 [Neolecta irregularis DAH-3]|uniref:Uncharacterized protein n=1 Tax=Neolecta irregularis (strain DAH-3) TaxID=1198029 RepID=A0A1U7LLH1_NEOID|nr:hypothetical protein NEOLI_004865 [Neolecta irregularis DAH-3]|eukprot:OLL23505.1 hypothetical protein NEOLI_004865 [Neolecta irregularis DAH-3]
MKSPSKVFRALSRPSSPIKVSTLLRRSKSKTERFTFPTHSKKPSGLVESTDGTKEQRIVQAIETFIQRLITDEELARYKLFQVQIENVQVVRDLCESLVKDPKRRWAVEGSPFPIALAAFVYLLDHIFVRKYGYVISTSTAVQLRQITGNLTGDEGKRTVLKEVLDGIGEDRWRVFSAFTKLLLAYLEKTENPPDKEATLVWAARLMAGPINKDIFLPVLNNIVDAGWHMLLNTTNKIKVSRASSQMSSATSFSNLSGYSLSGRSSHTTSQSSLKSHRSLSVMSLLPSNASRSSSAVSNGLGHKRSATCGRSTSSLASLDEFGMRQTKVRSSTVALSESYFQSKLRIKTNIEETLSVKTSGKASHSKSLIETDTIRVVSPDESEIPIKSLNVSSNPISQNTKPLSSLRELTPTPSKSCSSKTTEGSQHAAARYDSKTPVDKVNHVSGRTTQKATINRGGDFPIIPRSTTQRRESKITEQSLSESSNISGRPSPSPRNLRPSSTAREAHLSRGQRLAKQQQEMREKRIHNTSA